MDTAKLIESLFRWKKQVTVGETTLYMRVVSDAVIEDARKAALIASRRLRQSLRDVTSDDYLIYLDGVVEFTDEELRNAVTSLSSRDIAREYVNQNPRPVIEPLGDYPTQEQQEEHEAAKEARESEYFEALQAHLVSWQNEFTAGIARLSREQLEAMYKKHRADRVCEDEFTRAFEEFVVAASVYSDEKYRNRAFTVVEYRQLPTKVKEYLRTEYNTLSMQMDDVKN
jgi:hypothetical protein